jgi:hypothetical protein
MMLSGAGEWRIPNHSVCENCHDITDAGNCAMCHKDEFHKKVQPLESAGYQKFAHSAHKSVECKTCHGEVEKKSPVFPLMADCQNCHRAKKGPLECQDCHYPVPKPQDHQLTTWMKDHGIEAVTGASECQACHEQESCAECHQGENIYGKPHSVDWIFNHFTEADFGGECLACHETRQFCTNCHRTMLPVPHPLGLIWANDDGGEHTAEAETFIETCLSCHDLGGDNPTCARCHSNGGSND